MPALPPVPGVIRCSVEGTLAGIPVANVFHLGYTGSPPSGQSLQQVALGMANAWSAHIAPLQCSDYIGQLWTATDLSSETGAEELLEQTVPGTAAGPPTPNNAAMVISKAVARRYRGGHPRTYLAGFPQSDMADGAHWTAAVATNAGQHWSQFISQILTSPGVPSLASEVVVHYIKNGLPLPAPLVDAFVGAIGRQVIGSMRRRLT